MVVHVGVTLALVGADLARDDTGVELGVNQLVRCFSLAREHARRRGAHLGAIEIRDDTAAKVVEMLGFAQARVRAGRAHIRARGKGAKGFSVVDHALLVGAGVAA